MSTHLPDRQPASSARPLEQAGGARRYAWLPLPVFAVGAVLLWSVAPAGVVESQMILTTLNTLLCSATSLLTAYLAARTYLATGESSMLALGSGALAYGIIYTISGPLIGNIDLSLTVHNIGVLLAGSCFLAGALLAFRPSSQEPHRASVLAVRLLLCYLSVVVVVGVVVSLAATDTLPHFFIAGQGPTALRQVVLALAVVAFLAAAAGVAAAHRNLGSPFARWYHLGLGMIGIGLGTIWLGPPGSALSWLGRSAQWVGGAYVLAGIFAAVKDSGTLALSMRTALYASERRFRSLFENMTEGVALHSVVHRDHQPVDYRIIDINDAFAAHTGISPEHARGSLASELYRESPPPFLDEYVRVAETGEPTILELHYQPLQRDFHITVVSPAKGMFATIFEDITERKRADRRLRESESRFRTLFETMAQGVIYQDASGHIISANPAAARILGLSLDELEGRTSEDPRWRAIREDGSPFPGEEHPAMVALRTGREVHDVIMGVTVPGCDDCRWIQAGAVPQYLPDETMPHHVYTTFTDVTARKQAEDALRASEAKYRGLFESHQETVALYKVVRDESGAIVERVLQEANPAFLRVVGVQALADVQGKTVSDIFGPAYSARNLPQIRAAMDSGESRVFESHRDHNDRDYVTTVVPLDGDIYLATGCDITEIKEAEAALRKSQAQSDLLAQTAGLLLSSDDPQPLIQALCEEVMRRLDCQVFLNFLEDEETGRLRLHAWAGIPDEQARKLEWLDDGATICGCVARDGRPVVAENILTEPDPRAAPVAAQGIQAFACHPLRSKEHIIGTLAFGTRSRSSFSPDELALLGAIADHVAIALVRRRIEYALRRSEETARQELEATQTLLEAAARLAEWTDIGRLTENLAHTLAALSDHSRVHLSVWNESAAHFEVAAAVGAYHTPLGLRIRLKDMSEAVRRAVAERRFCIVDHDAERAGDRGVATPADARLTLVVPMVHHDALVGLLSLDQPGEARPFSAREVRLVQGVASQAAVALENTRLYEAQRRIATTLQEQFIHPLPCIDGLEFACVAETAFSPELIGGDFHDVFALPHGLVAVLLGDVEGKGIRAAGLSETVRSAVRALAIVSPSPRYILNNVNRMLLQQQSEQFVTALLMITDPVRGITRLASAGHPPAVHLSPHTAVRVSTRPGPPLGTFDWDYEQTVLNLSPGDCLLAYTDGVSEARRGTQLFGEARILSAARALSGKAPAEIADGVHAAVLDFAGVLRDDLQLLVLKLLTLTESTRERHGAELRIAVPNAPWRLTDVRGSIRDFLSAHRVDEETSEDLVLCAEEACTNALRHSGSVEPAEVRVLIDDREIEITVRDHGRGISVEGLDLRRLPDPLATGGRGLYLIHTLADELRLLNDEGAVVCIRKRRPRP